MIDKLNKKIDDFMLKVNKHENWNIEDELLIQVLGFTMYGYAFGAGRLLYFLDQEDIDQAVIKALTNIGVGKKYAEGMINDAFQMFSDASEDSFESQLINIGHSHFASEDVTECVNSIFSNTEKLR